MRKYKRYGDKFVRVNYEYFPYWKCYQWKLEIVGQKTYTGQWGDSIGECWHLAKFNGILKIHTLRGRK